MNFNYFGPSAFIWSDNKSNCEGKLVDTEINVEQINTLKMLEKRMHINYKVEVKIDIFVVSVVRLYMPYHRHPFWVNALQQETDENLSQSKFTIQPTIFY